ncbi:MAG: membrane protein insertion efficiency factor YidD [Methylococcales bacterium]
MRIILISVIKTYQYFFSPWIGQHCRFYPTCSNYAIASIERFGIIFGILLTFNRLIRCQPFYPGGIDHVPQKLGKSNG